MKQLKREIKARVLPLKKERKIEADPKEVTAITRSLFCDTWHSFVDQASTVAVKFDQNFCANPKASPKKKKQILRIV